MLLSPNIKDPDDDVRTPHLLQRRNTVNDTRSMFRRRSRHSSARHRSSNLDCVIEQKESNQICSQQDEDIRVKKLCAVEDSYRTGHYHSLPRGSSLPLNCNSDIMNGMAWKSKQTPSTESSWLEVLSNKLSDRKKKKSTSLFSSMRGRSKEKRKNSEGTDSPVSGNNSPLSPLLLGPNRLRSDTDPARTKHKVVQTRQSIEFQGSTGFQLYESSEFSDSENTQLPLSSDFGSCKDLTSPRIIGIKQKVSVRKSNSLPRTVLCSPVLSRKVKRPTSQWFHQDFIQRELPLLSSSPSSSAISSHVGSEDTLQPSITTTEEAVTLKVVKPTKTEGWHLTAPHTEVKHKTSLTRSSSLPFDSDLLTSEHCLRKGIVEKLKNSELPCRMATRSQSFNTHFHDHSVTTHEEILMRHRVISFLLETEQSYILSLKVLSQDYMKLLSQNGVLECAPVKELFCSVEELSLLHNEFADRVEDRNTSWSDEQLIGDVLVDMFSSYHLLNVYSKYIQHYSQARSSIESCIQSQPVLARELQDCTRGHQSRLSLKDLLIKPVQRIPRYLLFVKDIMKHTPHTHSDYTLLQQALRELTNFANHVNESERMSDRIQQHRELLGTAEGLASCLTNSSTLIRCDGVTEIKGSAHRKDRILMLFSDTVVCASARRRSSGFKRGSLMNINSTQNSSDMLRYRVKWSSSLSSLSVTQSQAPLLERRRYNTLEKILHNSQKDEALLIQMTSLSSALHCPHQELNILLQDMLDQVRTGMSNKQHEIETLPNDSSRLDLISHDSSPPAKYFLIFSNQKEKQHWEQLLRNTQVGAASSPMLSGHHRMMRLDDSNEYHNVSSGLDIHSSQKVLLPKYMSLVTLPSCRVGSQLSAAAISHIDGNELFVCINDSCGRGSVAIVNTNSGSSPRLVATLPLSSARLLCAICVCHFTSPKVNDSRDRSSSPPDSLYSSTKEDPFTTPVKPHTDQTRIDTPSPDINQTSLNLAPTDFLRSSSAPPTSIKSVTSNDIRLNPSRLNECEQWLWLGSEGGILYLLKVGVSSLNVASSLSIDMGSSIKCLLSHDNHVWAGLDNGQIAKFNLDSGITTTFSQASSCSVTCLTVASHMIVATTGNKVVGVSLSSGEEKELLEVSSHHNLVGVVAENDQIFLSIEGSLTIYVCTLTGSSLDIISILDCTNTITSSLKNYDPILKQHKCSDPYITSMVSVESVLMIGTSAGVLICLSLPIIPGQSPSLMTLPKGHIDGINTLIASPLDHYHMIVTGGHGLEELLHAKLSDDVSEMEGCLTFWRKYHYTKL